MKKKIFSSLLLVAFTIATTSMFVSCKDYDDDINANASDIAALQTQLSTLQSSLTAAQSEATSAHATLQTAINAASSAASEAAKEAAAAKVEAAAAKEAAATAKAEAIAEAIEQCKTLIANKADQEDLNALATRVASIESTLLTLPSNIATVDDVEAAKKNLQDQIDALNYLKEILPEGTTLTDKLGDIETLKETVAKLQDEIEAAQKSIGDLGESVSNLSGQLTETQKEIKEQMEAINTKVDNFITEINVLQYLLDKQVTSLVLKPAFYHSGIEAIERPVIIDYKPIIVNDSTQDWVITNNEDSLVNIIGTGIAEYHINPTSADLTGYRMDFYGNLAETRSGEALATPATDVIDENFIKENYANGILQVPFYAYAKNSKIDWTDQNWVRSWYNGWIKSYGTDGILPMVALQLSKESATNSSDSVITSDYGVVSVTRYQSFYLANNIWKETSYAHSTQIYYSDDNSLNQKLGVQGHLHTNYKAITSTNTKNTITFNVRYDSSIDLRDYIRTHYNYTSQIAGETVNVNDREMSNNIFKGLGLKYRYTPIDYELKDSKTSESQHIEVSDSGVCRPVKVDANGKRTAEQADRASAGRLPIIRVDLLDANDNILAVGFVKLQIVEDEEVETIVDQVLSDQVAYVDCKGKGQGAAMTWAKFETNVYSALNLSRESFEEGYSLSGSNSNATQYYAADETKKKDNYTRNDEEYDIDHLLLGKVYRGSDGYDSYTTDTLVWKFTANDIEKLKALQEFESRKYGMEIKYIKDGKTTVDLVTYICFKGAKNVYIKLTLPAGNLLYVSGTVTNKVLAQWYQLNTKTKATSNADAKDVHINVPVPTSKTAAALTASDFTKDLQELFVDRKVKVDGIDEKKFTEFVNLAKLTFEFTTPAIAKGNAEFDATEYVRDKYGDVVDSYWTVYGESLKEETLTNGEDTLKQKEYTLTVGEDALGNSIIKAVEINKNGKITSTLATVVTLTPQGQITYGDNAVAFDILNYASHNDLKSKETFSAYIKIKYTACYEAEILDNSEYFNARFLRPVNLNASDKAELTDAPNGEQWVYEKNLYGLTDWRDYPLIDEYGDFTKNVVKSYYGATVSFGTEEEIYTDMDLGENDRIVKTSNDIIGIRSLNLVTSISGLKFTPSTDVDGNAGYKYENNNTNVGTFHIYVPVYLKYTWGTQTRYAVVTVKDTINQK